MARARARLGRADDHDALRGFSCNQIGTWYARHVENLIRRKVAKLVQEPDPAYDVILTEVERGIVAVAVLRVELRRDEFCDLDVVAVSDAYQGARVETERGEMPLPKAVLDTMLARARPLGAEGARALVARDNRRSLEMLTKGRLRSGRIS